MSWKKSVYKFAFNFNHKNAILTQDFASSLNCFFFSVTKPWRVPKHPWQGRSHQQDSHSPPPTPMFSIPSLSPWDSSMVNLMLLLMSGKFQCIWHKSGSVDKLARKATLLKVFSASIVSRVIFYKERIYSEIPLLRPPKIQTFYLLTPLFWKLKYSFLHFLHPVYILLEITFGTVQKWSLRPLLDSHKGGLNIGILLYFRGANSFFLEETSFIWGSVQRKAKDVLFFEKMQKICRMYHLPLI